MNSPNLPVGEGDVPDKVLEELLLAFAGDEPPAGKDIDLDDPSIDALLGLTPSSPIATPAMETPAKETPDMETSDDSVEIVTSQLPATEPDAEPGPQPDPGPGDRETPLTSGESHDLAAGLRTEPIPATVAPDSSPEASGPAAIRPRIQIGGDAPAARTPIQIGGSDDDLIDAVYLDEEGADRLRGDSGRSTEASVERTTILIGDDEIEGSAGGIPVATGSAMDPRLRARRIAVKRAVGRRRLKWFVVGGVVVAVIAGALALLGSSLFAVDEVAASGVTVRTQAAYDDALKELEGQPVLLIDTNAIESQLEKNPWIREARVETDFPNRASVEIVERVPLATYVGADLRWRIIDVEGVVLTVIDGQPLEFMKISGPGAAAEAGGAAGDAFRRAAELVEALSPAVRSRTEEVVVGDTGELSLRFANTEVILGAPENLLDKLTRLEAVLKMSGADEFTLINVSTPEISKK